MIDNVTSAIAPTATPAGTYIRHTPFGDAVMRIDPQDQDFASLFGQATAAAETATPAGTPSTASTNSALVNLAVTTPSVPATTPAAPVTTPAATSGSVKEPGLTALINAMADGTFQATYITDPARLTEVGPLRTTQMPNFYYASDSTAAQLAELLGGKVVQMPAFGQSSGWIEPLANFIELPNGMQVNAADIAYYARYAKQGTKQLAASLTAEINIGAAYTEFYKTGKTFELFPPGYVGPPIPGLKYPEGSLNSDGSVINPWATNTAT